MNRLQILQQALATQDPAKLFSLVEEALALAQDEGISKAFAQSKVKKLEDQVRRQTVMIENLENALYGKRK